MSGIELPEGFNEKLIEVVDPLQSVDYLELTSSSMVVLPIRVPVISLERKLLRLQRIVGKEDQDKANDLSAIEIVRFYYPELMTDWVSCNLTEEDQNRLIEGHLEKCQYNDTIIQVVSEINKQIKWQPVDKEERASWDKYLPASVFVPAMVFSNYMSERNHPRYFLDNTTRGLWELMKLSQLISSDKIASIRASRGKDKPEADPKGDKVSEDLRQAKTLDEYLEAFNSQGVNLRDLAG